jgi:hypothetical protein
MNSFILSQKVIISFFDEPALAIKNPKCLDSNQVFDKGMHRKSALKKK